MLEVSAFHDGSGRLSHVSLLDNRLILGGRHGPGTLGHEVVGEILTFWRNILPRRCESIERLLACSLRLGASLDSGRLWFLASLYFNDVRSSTFTAHIVGLRLQSSWVVGLNCLTQDSHLSPCQHMTYTSVCLSHRWKQPLLLHLKLGLSSRSRQLSIRDILDNVGLDLLDVIGSLLKPRCHKLPRLLHSIAPSDHLAELLDVDW